jgi:heat-inducible transcriptional repressor
MHLPVVTVGEATQMRRLVESAASELDTILRQTCRILADMTRLPAVATPPHTGDVYLRQIIASPAGADKTLLVLLFSNGSTESRLLSLKTDTSDAWMLVNALNDRWGGAAVTSLVTTTSVGPAPSEIGHLKSHFVRISEEILSAARRLGADAPMYVEGTHAVLEHPEFRDVERISQLMATLQERAAMIALLRTALDTTQNAPFETPVRVAIGGEMGRADLADYSVVTSPYYIGGRECGSIGVLGPTRMDYARAASAVGLMARTVGDLLTRLSVA